MKKIIVANWKMQLSITDSYKLIKSYTILAKKYQNILKDFELVISPDFLSLDKAQANFKSSVLKIAAQNCACVDYGPWTGEVSAVNLKKIGTNYVILGHSERRQKLKEDGVLISEKLKAALNNKLIPIVCVGEDLAQRKSGFVKKVLLEQLKLVLRDVKIKKANDLIIAYEPIWAIGSGQTPLLSDIEKIHEFLQVQVVKILNHNIRIIYGGSVTKENAPQILNTSSVSGLLVGGFSLQASNFFDLIKKIVK